MYSKLYAINYIYVIKRQLNCISWNHKKIKPRFCKILGLQYEFQNLGSTKTKVFFNLGLEIFAISAIMFKSAQFGLNFFFFSII